jgi:hypothetical protein
VLLAVTLAGLGASVAAGVALAAEALHPIAMYLILSALLAGATIPAIMMVREYRRCSNVRKRLLAGTIQMPVPMMLVTSGAPTFTVGGQGTVTTVTGANSIVQQQMQRPHRLQCPPKIPLRPTDQPQ